MKKKALLFCSKVTSHSQKDSTKVEGLTFFSKRHTKAGITWDENSDYGIFILFFKICLFPKIQKIIQNIFFDKIIEHQIYCHELCPRNTIFLFTKRFMPFRNWRIYVLYALGIQHSLFFFVKYQIYVTNNSNSKIDETWFYA